MRNFEKIKLKITDLHTALPINSLNVVLFLRRHSSKGLILGWRWKHVVFKTHSDISRSSLQTNNILVLSLASLQIHFIIHLTHMTFYYSVHDIPLALNISLTWSKLNLSFRSQRKPSTPFLTQWKLKLPNSWDTLGDSTGSNTSWFASESCSLQLAGKFLDAKDHFSFVFVSLHYLV